MARRNRTIKLVRGRALSLTAREYSRYPTARLGEVNSVPIVLDNKAAAGLLLFDWPLCRLAATVFGLVPSPAAAGTLDADRFRRVDEQDGVAFLVEAGFEEERGIVDHAWRNAARSGRGGLNRFAAALGDERMDELFEALSLARIGEDDRADGRAVNMAVGCEDCGTPPFDQRLLDIRKEERGLGFGVGIDHDPTERGELLSDRGLAAADAARDAEDHRPARRIIG